MIITRGFGVYFGAAWPSGICDEGTPVTTPVATPVGEHCGLCCERIVDGDQGTFVTGFDERGGFTPQHRECGLRSVMGGIGHLEDHNYWCIEQNDPDGGRSYRISSLLVWDYFNGCSVCGMRIGHWDGCPRGPSSSTV